MKLIEALKANYSYWISDKGEVFKSSDHYNFLAKKFKIYDPDKLIDLWEDKIQSGWIRVWPTVNTLNIELEAGVPTTKLSKQVLYNEIRDSLYGSVVVDFCTNGRQVKSKKYEFDLFLKILKNL